jgi:hypothetical protein
LGAKISKPDYPEKIQNSLYISKGKFRLGVWQFESSRPSQPVWILENIIFGGRKARQWRAF